MATGMKIVITDTPDSENVFAELSYDDKEWAIISQEEGPLVLEIYSNPDLNPMKFELDEVIEVLMKAKRKLIGDRAADTG